MNKRDFQFIGILLILILPFVISNTIYAAYQDFNSAHGIIMSFIKFALLATLGESLGLRIRSGKFNYSGFGLLPRAIVWGFLGVSVKIAFIIFASGTPVLLEYIGLDHASQIITGSVSPAKILIAFSISATLNIFYAPVLMTTHKITDTHIINTGGTIKGLFSPVRMGDIMQSIDWKVQWEFVFKRTIPLFWIPAQTITFLLPVEFQILFAAFLSIVLGILMAVASQMGKRELLIESSIPD
ncbi:MAG TPA: Mpv17/PMP22 family protein [Bacteroidales bacterium]|nr:Mpv17/PMP22 family protein [Bacteroidales bacterium]